MKYVKPAFSLDALIEKVEDWGVLVATYADTERFLTHLDFFKFKQYYFALKVQMERGSTRFDRKYIQFSDIKSLYEFDRTLRLHLLEALEQIELSIKSALVRHLSLKFGPMGYIDAVPMKSGSQHKEFLQQLKKSVEIKSVFNDPVFKRYKKKYSSVVLPPIWISVEAMSFGMLIRWFSNLKFRHDRQVISNQYQLDEKILISFIRSLVVIRNSCAHNQQVWNKVGKTFKLPRSQVTFAESVNFSGQRLLYNSLAGLCFLIDIINPESMWKDELVAILDRQHIVKLSAMGFPKNWRELPVWKV